MRDRNCYSCGVEKDEEILNHCGWCGSLFCGLCYDIGEEICDGCACEQKGLSKIMLNDFVVVDTGQRINTSIFVRN